MTLSQPECEVCLILLKNHEMSAIELARAQNKGVYTIYDAIKLLADKKLIIDHKAIRPDEHGRDMKIKLTPKGERVAKLLCQLEQELTNNPQ